MENLIFQVLWFPMTVQHNSKEQICSIKIVRVLSHFSHVQLFATLWTKACEAPLSVGCSRQEYWRGLPCPPPGDFSQPRD